MMADWLVGCLSNYGDGVPQKAEGFRLALVGWFLKKQVCINRRDTSPSGGLFKDFTHFYFPCLGKPAKIVTKNNTQHKQNNFPPELDPRQQFEVAYLNTRQQN